MSDSVTYDSTIPAVQAYSPSAVRSVGPRRHQYTWLMRLRMTTSALGGASGGTEFYTIDIPDDFYAVRVAFANVTTTPYDVTLVKAVASADCSSYYIPVDAAGVALDDAAWSTLTFLNAGADVPEIVTAAGVPTAIEVAANATDDATGETNNPAWTWTDWVQCTSRGADPTTGMRRLMIRGLVPSSQTVTYNAIGPWNGWTGVPSVNYGYDVFIGGRRSNADFVTSPDDAESLTLEELDFRLVSGNIIALVQVMTKRPCVQGIAVGDSTMAGTDTTIEAYSMALQATVQTGQKYVGSVAWGFCCAATGGATNDQFFPRYQTLLPHVNPTWVLFPGWTSNDFVVGGLSPTEALSYFGARWTLAADETRDNGAVPIFCTPWGYPEEDLTDEIVTAWREFRQRTLLQAHAGEAVVDPWGSVGAYNVDTPLVYYRDGYSADGLHPNNAANGIGAVLLQPIVIRIAGL